MATSNKLLLGLLLTVLLFVTVMLSIGKYYGMGSHINIDFDDKSEAPLPPTPPSAPEAPTAPATPEAPVPAN